MSMTMIAPEQVNRIVWNQHQDPFEILGSHLVEANGKTVWAVRAYLPNASQAWVILPEERKEYPMQSVHDPHFFECAIETKELANYQLKIKRRRTRKSHLRPLRLPFSSLN